MNTQERILKLSLGGKPTSRLYLALSKSAYEAALAGMDPNDANTTSRQDEARAYLESVYNQTSANPYAGKKGREREGRAYEIATLILNGTANTASIVDPSTLRGKSDSNHTYVDFKMKNMAKGVALNNIQTAPTVLGRATHLFSFNDGMPTSTILGQNETIGSKAKGYAEALMRNLKSAIDAKEQGAYVSGWKDGMKDHYNSLAQKLSPESNFDWEKDGYNELAKIAQYYDDGTYWDSYFKGVLPKETEADKNHKARIAEGWLDYDLADQSQTVRDLLNSKNLVVMKDANGNKKVFNKDWSDYTGGDFVDYNDDWQLVGTDGLGSSRGYHHGIILNNGNLHLGDLDQLGDNDPLKQIFLNELATRVSRRNPLVQLIRWDATNSDTDDDFVRQIVDEKYKDKNFAGADVSQLFRGLDQRVFAVNGSGADIFKRDIDGNITFNAGTKFYTRDEEGHLVEQTWDSIKKDYNRNGFNEDKLLGTIYRWDGNIDDIQSSIDLDQDMGGRSYWDSSAWNSNLWKNMFRSGKDFAAFWKSGILGNPFSYNAMDNINEDKKGFVLNLLNALNDQNGKLKVNLVGVDNNADLLNKLKYFEKLDDYNALLIQLIEKDKSVNIEDLKTNYPELYKYYAELKNRYFRKQGKRSVVQSEKQGGHITFAEMGTIIDGAGEAITKPKYAETTRTKIQKSLDKYNLKEQEARDLGYNSGKQMDANKKGVFKGDGSMTTADIMRLGTMAQDVASVVASFVPGAGTGVAAGLGVTSMFTDLGADILDPAVSGGEVAKNMAINAGFAAIGMIPGAKAGKVLKNCIKWAPRIMMAAGALNIAMDDSTQETFAKLLKGGKDFNRLDWRNLSHVISLVAAGTRGAKGAYDRHKVSGASTIAKDNVKISGVKDSVTGKDLELPKKTIDSINESLKEVKTVDEAKAKLIDLKNENGQPIFTEKLAIDLIKENGWLKSKTGTKFQINSEKLKETATEEATNKSYDAIRELWNKDAEALKAQSETSTGRAAIWFANKFGGGAYGAKLRALMMEDAVSPEVMKLAYEGKYNPMIDWKGLRGKAATELLPERVAEVILTPQEGVATPEVRIKKMRAHKRSLHLEPQQESHFNGNDQIADDIHVAPLQESTSLTSLELVRVINRELPSKSYSPARAARSSAKSSIDPIAELNVLRLTRERALQEVGNKGVIPGSKEALLFEALDAREAQLLEMLPKEPKGVLEAASDPGFRQDFNSRESILENRAEELLPKLMKTAFRKGNKKLDLKTEHPYIVGAHALSRPNLYTKKEIADLVKEINLELKLYDIPTGKLLVSKLRTLLDEGHFLRLGGYL